MAKKAILSAIFPLFLSTLSFAVEDNELLSSQLTSSINKETRFTSDEKKISLEYPDYFTIDENSIKITLKEVKDEDSSIYQPTSIIASQSPQKDIQGSLVTIEKIVNIASKIWDIIKDNAPVSNIDTKYATALPQGVTSPRQLTGWSKPRVYIFGFYAENLYGVKAVDVEYRVVYTFGGSYNGKGKYLTGVSVVPTKVDVLWGYRFDMQSYVPDSTVVNVGTSQKPIAALQLKLTWNISTSIKDSKGTAVYYIQGDGYFNEIASPFRSKSIDKMMELNPSKVF